MYNPCPFSHDSIIVQHIRILTSVVFVVPFAAQNPSRIAMELVAYSYDTSQIKDLELIFLQVSDGPIVRRFQVYGAASDGLGCVHKLMHMVKNPTFSGGDVLVFSCRCATYSTSTQSTNTPHPTIVVIRYRSIT